MGVAATRRELRAPHHAGRVDDRAPAYPAIVETQWDVAAWDVDTWSLGADPDTREGARMTNPNRPQYQETIESAWGQAVADTVVRRYATAAERDADLAAFTPAELKGQLVAVGVALDLSQRRRLVAAAHGERHAERRLRGRL